MMKSRKWAAWLALGALAANLMMPLGAGATGFDVEPRGPAPSYGDPDEPSGSPQAQRTYVFLETMQVGIVAVPVVFISWSRHESARPLFRRGLRR